MERNENQMKQQWYDERHDWNRTNAGLKEQIERANSEMEGMRKQLEEIQATIARRNEEEKLGGNIAPKGSPEMDYSESTDEGEVEAGGGEGSHTDAEEKDRQTQEEMGITQGTGTSLSLLQQDAPIDEGKEGGAVTGDVKAPRRHRRG